MKLSSRTSAPVPVLPSTTTNLADTVDDFDTSIQAAPPSVQQQQEPQMSSTVATALEQIVGQLNMLTEVGSLVYFSYSFMLPFGSHF